MVKIKPLGLAVLMFVVVGLTAQVSCASSGNKKPVIYYDKNNVIPADIPSQFTERYRWFITSKERKEFQKLITDEERRVFIDSFWSKRDTDPTTPDNEYKQEIDQRIEDIANERFFETSSATGLLFRSNGRFYGDMARVYLLHGEPDAMDLLEGHLFTPLMLWVYLNPENGEILYAFMFYQKGSSGEFRLFYQDSYKIDPCGAIYEISALRIYNYSSGMRTCPEDLYEAYNELLRSNGKGGVLDGNIFAWALFNFSSDFNLKIDKAIDPPKPASEVAKESKARVVGEAPELIGKIGTDYIINYCEGCNSLIPAQLMLDKELALSIRRSEVDWRVINDEVRIELKTRIVVEDVSGQKPPLVFEKNITFTDKKDLIVSDSSGLITITLLNEDWMTQVPAGNYRVSVYVKNMMTQKYNAWDVQFTK